MTHPSLNQHQRNFQNRYKSIADLDGLHFDNAFVSELPGDPDASNQIRQVDGACYSLVNPTPVCHPKLIAYSREMAEQLDLSAAICTSDDFVQVFAGNRVTSGMKPYAMCYGGHQFGHWAGQLGDGRAINLGDTINSNGERFTLQLKGAGLTPYSRTADGLAVLRSSVREFLCSEAMHHLGVPTTRALSLIATGEKVMRDMFYDGNPKLEPGAIVCRVAPTFLRFGNFEILTARQDLKLLKQLVDFTLKMHFPHLGKPSKDSYSQWFQEICTKTAEMIVHWQRVGFVHGVMNTDNMSILGLTIDYGPYGWLENYDPNWTPNTTDSNGRRYRFGHQPQIAYWNLMQLAKAIFPLIDSVEPLQDGLNQYSQIFEAGWHNMMLAKLGLSQLDNSDDGQLFIDLLSLLKTIETDMTLFFRNLANLPLPFAKSNQESCIRILEPAFYDPAQVTGAYQISLLEWLKRYSARLELEQQPHSDRKQKMDAVNPKYVLRNYLAQQAIDLAEQSDYSMIHELMDVLRKPYDDQPGKDKFAAKRPDWARHRAGCSMLSCSS